MMDSVFRFIWNRPWILLAVSIWLLAFTGNKLWKMAQINGWVPGADTVEVAVTEKSASETELRHGVGDTVYWLIWQDGRTNVTREIWQGVQMSDRLELRRLPGEGKLYYEGGIYASPGNFVFDFVLLGLEFVLFFCALTRLVIRFRQKQSMTRGEI